MQSTGQASTQAVSFTPMQGSAMTYAIGHLLLQSYASRREDSSEAEVNCWHHGNHGGENFGDTLRRGEFCGAAGGLVKEDVPHIKQPILGGGTVPPPPQPPGHPVKEKGVAS